MKIVTNKNPLIPNSSILVKLTKPTKFNKIVVTCSNYYTIFINNEIVEYGPTRTSKYHARTREIKVKDSQDIQIYILYYGFSSFDIEKQPFFFGINLFLNKKIVATTYDFTFLLDDIYISQSSKYSFQRGLIERYDFKKSVNDYPLIEVKEYKDIKILENIKIKNHYSIMPFTLFKKMPFNGFDEVLDRAYLRYDSLKDINQYDVDKNFLEYTKKGYNALFFKLDGVKSGLFKIKISSLEKNAKIFLVFDEIYNDNKWIYGRSNCNDFIEINCPNGQYIFTSKSIYCCQYLMILVPSSLVVISAELILIENSHSLAMPFFEDMDLKLIYEASLNTYRQNSYDIFTDCPGRERAPWLCNSYFMGIAEFYYSGNNHIEKRFLTNYLYQNCASIPKNMFAMCYPSDHDDHTFIPNWAMWLVVELYSYNQRNKDKELVNAFKDKLYNLLTYFRQYENEYKLLENLPSWVFVEWSAANDYVSGVNFPSNMLYAYMMKCIGELYNDEGLIIASKQLTKTINNMAFDGIYYDHATRDSNNNLVVNKNDKSETCQYYALFFGLTNDNKFREKMKNINNDILIKEDIKPSAIFIGKFLRMLWLLKENEKDILINEIKDNFIDMSIKTKTIWEKDGAIASCNHGLGAILGYIISKCIKN